MLAGGCLSGAHPPYRRISFEPWRRAPPGVRAGADEIDRRRDDTAIGNRVNLAACLESECPPGGILVSHATWALVRGEIPCDPQGELRVKGIHYPVRVYGVRQTPGIAADIPPGGSAV